MNQSSTVWGIHAGVSGEADALFLEKNVVSIGWSQIGDLDRAGRDREEIKKKVAEIYPKYKAGKVPVVAGMLYRFVHEIREGDFVVYPRKADRTLRLGRVVGPYRYRPELMDQYPNTRSVKWEGERPRTAFGQTALYEVGSALSLFQVREHAEQILSVFAGETTAVDEPGDTQVVASDSEESTEDFVIRRLEQALKGAPLERFIKDLLEAMGYRCRLTKVSGDGGIDVEAARGPLGFEPPIVRAQVKSTTDNLGDAPVKHLYASINQGEYGLLVTLGGFSKPAVEYAKTRPNISLVNGAGLVALILEHYEQLSPMSKALAPLRRSYVPDVGGE